eukprot:5716555-Lingulodinium_polyedra.AAC.1
MSRHHSTECRGIDVAVQGKMTENAETPDYIVPVPPVAVLQLISRENARRARGIIFVEARPLRHMRVEYHFCTEWDQLPLEILAVN